MCFFVLYHYETNAILPLPISGFSNEVIFDAYKQQYKLLESKGFMIKLNVMDNQASAIIKKYLTTKQCNQMVVEPHNHRVKTVKAHFISTLATTDNKFPLQLWECLTPQVENTLNMLCPSWIDPSKSAYKAINSPYDWNQLPLAPPGCKAVTYESPESQGSWGSCSTNAWCVGPLLNHCRCNRFFVPGTRTYPISSSAELFPQHCQVPFFM